VLRGCEAVLGDLIGDESVLLQRPVHIRQFGLLAFYWRVCSARGAPNSQIGFCSAAFIPVTLTQKRDRQS
jgi:hypothetical protein